MDGLLLLNGGCLLLVLLLRQLEVILNLLLVESGTLQALILQANRRSKTTTVKRLFNWYKVIFRTPK